MITTMRIHRKDPSQIGWVAMGVYLGFTECAWKAMGQRDSRYLRNFVYYCPVYAQGFKALDARLFRAYWYRYMNWIVARSNRRKARLERELEAGTAGAEESNGNLNEASDADERHPINIKKTGDEVQVVEVHPDVDELVEPSDEVQLAEVVLDVDEPRK
jgi:hypothetical protein